MTSDCCQSLRGQEMGSKMGSERDFSLKTITHCPAAKVLERESLAAAKLSTYKDTQGQNAMAGKQA